MEGSNKIEFQCPGCGKTLCVAEQHTGKKARCPHCQRIITVPTSTPPDPLASKDNKPNNSIEQPSECESGNQDDAATTQIPDNALKDDNQQPKTIEDGDPAVRKHVFVPKLITLGGVILAASIMFGLFSFIGGIVFLASEHGEWHGEIPMYSTYTAHTFHEDFSIQSTDKTWPIIGIAMMLGGILLIICGVLGYAFCKWLHDIRLSVARLAELSAASTASDTKDVGNKKTATIALTRLNRE